MHFWIDKRSEECGFHGRRQDSLLLPPGPSSSGSYHLGSGRGLGRRRKPPMVTPVHRFQPIDSLREELQQQQQARRANSAGHARRRRSRSRESGHRARERLAPDMGAPPASRDPSPNSPLPNGLVVHTQTGLSPETSVYLSVPSEDGTSRRASTSASSTAAAASPRYVPAASPGGSVAFLPMGRLKCVMWACFALLTVLVASAKFYLDHYRAGFELLGLALVLLLFLLVGCTVSFFRLKTRRYLVSRVAGDDPTGGEGGGGSSAAIHHRLLLLPSSSSPISSNRFYRPQRLTLRPVRVSRSQPNMQELPNGTGGQESNSQQEGSSRGEPPPPTAPNNTVAVLAASLALRRSHSTYSQQTMTSLSPSEGWSDGAPPPYHLAILLPAPPLIEPPLRRQGSSETPPPSYEKAIS